MINDGCAGLRDLRPEVQKRTPAALTRREKKPAPACCAVAG